MKIGNRFCLDDRKDKCQREVIDGCEGCVLFITYQECEICGDDSTCVSIYSNGLCGECNTREEYYKCLEQVNELCVL